MTAAPFCYGPTAKLLCLASELQAGHRITYVGGEPGLSLARSAHFDEVIRNDDRDNWNSNALAALTRADCLVSALDARALNVAANCGVPTAFIDTLLWLRTEALPHSRIADLYIAQAFFRSHSEQVVAGFSNFLTVGPILPKSIEMARPPGRDEGILVNFGGLTSPVMENAADTRFIEWILKAIREANLGRRRLVVCIPLHLASAGALATKLLPNAQIHSPSASEFHELVAECRVLLTVPGLEVALEALYLSRELVFLPPHNGTQALQLLEYQANGIGRACMSECFTAGNEFSGDLHSLTKAIQRRNLQNSLSKDATDALTEGILRGVGFALEGVGGCAGPTRLAALGANGRVEASRRIAELVARAAT